MDWSVSEDSRVRIGAALACLTRLHSHFMAEWEPKPGGAVPHASYWTFRKQSLPYYCAVQHENACFEAKFFVTFSFALG
jgi:hypothetical protein